MTWEVKKLEDICDFQNGYAFKSKDYVISGMPIIRITNIKNQKIDDTSLVYIDLPNLSKLDSFIVNPGDLLIAMSGATTGKIGFNTTNKIFYLNQRVGKFKPKKELNLKFLYYFLLTKVEDNLKISQGSAQPNLSTNQINNFLIPGPSLSEQKKIVRILDAAFEKIANAKENAEINLKNLKEIFESYLNDIFEKKGKDWEEKTIKEVSKELFAGGDVPKDNYSKSKNDNYQIPIYSNGVKDKGLYGYTYFSRVKEPSITISARGTIGYSEIRTEEYLPVVRLIVVIPQKFIDIKLLSYSFLTLDFVKSGTSIPQLTIPMVKNYKISFPKSLEKQKQIVKKLDQLSEKTKKLEEIYNKKLKDLDELKKSILEKAFKGELTKDIYE